MIFTLKSENYERKKKKKGNKFSLRWGYILNKLWKLLIIKKKSKSKCGKTFLVSIAAKELNQSNIFLFDLEELER